MLPDACTAILVHYSLGCTTLRLPAACASASFLVSPNEQLGRQRRSGISNLLTPISITFFVVEPWPAFFSISLYLPFSPSPYAR
jgi:hypothetical protein